MSPRGLCLGRLATGHATRHQVMEVNLSKMMVEQCLAARLLIWNLWQNPS